MHRPIEDSNEYGNPRFLFGIRFLILPLLAWVAGSSCAHRGALQEVAQTRDAPKVLAEICAIGNDIIGSTGTLQVKAKSTEASGQFPATVKASLEPHTLDLEVTNPLGGTEARILVRDSKYDISAGSGKKARHEAGARSWGGIPLDWSVDLFLGKVPCPNRTLKNVTFSEDGRLRAETASDLEGAGELFLYTIENGSATGSVWPVALEWSRAGVFATAVKFKFSGPEDGTRSPTRWEAVSDRGEVKAKWREREVQRKRVSGAEGSGENG
jgi:hypothetical protein